jgi:hypothetical protein
MVLWQKNLELFLRRCYACYHYWMIMKLWLTSFNFFFTILYTTFFTCVFSLHKYSVYISYIGGWNWENLFNRQILAQYCEVKMWKMLTRKRERDVCCYGLCWIFLHILSRILFFVFILSRFMWKHASSISVILILFFPSTSHIASS